MYFSILAGGSGKRFWPISRRKKPKQFINILDEKTMFEHTIDRILPIAEKGKIYVITGAEHRKIIEEIIKKRYMDMEIKIIYEPFSRDTAPAVGLVNEMIYRDDPDAVVVSLHSDHYIEKEDIFSEIINVGVERATSSCDIVLLGIKPTFPSTGFGYIEAGDELGNIKDHKIHQVLSFKEKPERSLAEKYLNKGNYFWNSGMFIWKAAKILNEIKVHEPDLYNGLKKINTSKTIEYATTFAEFKNQPIDKAVLEKTKTISVIPSDIGWNDVGSWNAIYDMKKTELKPAKDNVFEAKVKSYNSKGCFVKSNNKKLISLIGLEDLIFIESEDAILLTKRSEVQSIKNFYEMLEKEGNYKEYL